MNMNNDDIIRQDQIIVSCIEDANRYWNLGRHSEAMSAILKCEIFIADEIYAYKSNYIVSDSCIKNIERVSNWYLNKKVTEKYICFMNIICNWLSRNLYHHMNNMSLRKLFFDTLSNYNLLGRHNEAFELSYKILDLVVRAQNENYFDIYEYWHRDMSHVKFYYDKLMPTIKSRIADYHRFMDDLKYLNMLCGYIQETDDYDYGIHIDDDDIHFCALCQQELAPYTANGVVGFADKTKRIKIPPIYSRARAFSEGLAAVQVGDNGLWGFINHVGQMVVHNKYNGVGDFHEGLAWVCIDESKKGFGHRGGKFGFIDTKGNIVIDLEYDDISSFMHGYAIAYKDNQLGEIKINNPLN